MTKTLTTDVQRSNAELQLFSARRALGHLVEMYDKGQWRIHYKKEEAFAEAVRNARQVVDSCDMQRGTRLATPFDAGALFIYGNRKGATPPKVCVVPS